MTRRTPLTQLLTVWPLLCGVTSVSAQAPQAPPPQPLPHPELPPVPAPPVEIALWVWIISGLLIALLLGLILWLLLRPRPLRPASPVNARQIALRALRSLHSDSDSLPPPEIGHRVSVILRQYLENRYRIPAPYRTTPELFSNAATNTERAVATSGLLQLRPVPTSPPPSIVSQFAPLAEFWDQLSFAPSPATPAESRSLIEIAILRIEEDPA
jgi:hypothetical protein